MTQHDLFPNNSIEMAGANTLALMIAPSRHETLHELTGEGTGAALPFALGLHVVDFQLANLLRAGIRDVIVVQPEGTGRLLQDHLREVWQPIFSRIACLSGPVQPEFGGFGLPVLRRCLALIQAIAPRDLLLLSADQICDPDLSAMLNAHRRSGAVVTIEAHPGEDPTLRLRDWLPALSVARTAQTGMMLFDWSWLSGGLETERITGTTLPQHVIDQVNGAERLQVWSGDEQRSYWRSLDSLDSFRVTWLDFLGTEVPPCRLPHCITALTDAGAARPPLVQPNVRDSVIMPGASVAPRAFVSRAIIAAGAHIPDGLVIGRDPELDARNFRLTPGGTVLVTAEMLAALS